MHKQVMRSWDTGDAGMRRAGIGKGAPLYLRQGGARLLTEVTAGKGGWGRMGGGQHRCGWVFCLWMEWGEESGWRHAGVRDRDTDNMEKPGRTLDIRAVAAGVRMSQMFRCCSVCFGLLREFTETQTFSLTVCWQCGHLFHTKLFCNSILSHFNNCGKEKEKTVTQAS